MVHAFFDFVLTIKVIGGLCPSWKAVICTFVFLFLRRRIAVAVTRLLLSQYY